MKLPRWRHHIFPTPSKVTERARALPITSSRAVAIGADGHAGILESHDVVRSGWVSKP
jgi:hypothetical protein